MQTTHNWWAHVQKKNLFDTYRENLYNYKFFNVHIVSNVDFDYVYITVGTPGINPTTQYLKNRINSNTNKIPRLEVLMGLILPTVVGLSPSLLGAGLSGWEGILKKDSFSRTSFDTEYCLPSPYGALKEKQSLLSRVSNLMFQWTFKH